MDLLDKVTCIQEVQLKSQFPQLHTERQWLQTHTDEG